MTLNSICQFDIIREYLLKLIFIRKMRNGKFGMDAISNMINIKYFSTKYLATFSEEKKSSFHILFTVKIATAYRLNSISEYIP